MPNLCKKAYEFALSIAGLVLLMSCSTFSQVQVTPTAAAIDDRNLTAIALEAATKLGLQGNPIAQRTVRLTLGEWAGLNNQSLPGDQNKPVFVLAIVGRVEWKGPGEPRPDPRRTYEGMVIVLDAQTGGIVQVSASPTASLMPIHVPLNAQTPAAPVSVKTLPPRTPPTLGPTTTPQVAPLQPATPTPSSPASRPGYP